MLSPSALVDNHILALYLVRGVVVVIVVIVVVVVGIVVVMQCLSVFLFRWNKSLFQT